MPVKHATREAWLAAAVEAFRPRLKPHGDLPKKLHVLVSWLKGASDKAIGAHYGPQWATDGSVHLMISPVLGQDAARVLDVLLHELLHALGHKNHGGPFKEAATALGLTGRMTATVAGPELRQDLEKLAKQLGPYPHAPMQLAKKPKEPAGEKRMLKFTSPVVKYSAWVTVKQAEEHGAPRCPVSGKPMETSD